MWETLFDPSMIGGEKEIAILCRDADDAEILVKFLHDNRIRWASNSNPLHTNWDTYKRNTVYFIDKDLELTYANREWAEFYREVYLLCSYSGNLSYSAVEVEDLL